MRITRVWSDRHNRRVVELEPLGVDQLDQDITAIGRIAGPDNLMAAWQCPGLAGLAPPGRQLPAGLMQAPIRQSPAGEHGAAGT